MVSEIVYIAMHYGASHSFAHYGAHNEAENSMQIVIRLYGKNDFTKVSTNLTRYRSENNFIRLLK